MNIRAPAREWLANGEHGSSSWALFCHIHDIRIRDGYRRQAHPVDASDWRRCQLMLEQTRTEKHLSRAAALSREWKALVRVWPQIMAAMEAQAPAWRTTWRWSAPSAYDLIQAAIKSPTRRR